jgi:hypothetical protein
MTKLLKAGYNLLLTSWDFKMTSRQFLTCLSKAEKKKEPSNMVGYQRYHLFLLLNITPPSHPVEVEGKAKTHVYVMKAYCGSRSIAPRILIREIIRE